MYTGLHSVARRGLYSAVISSITVGCCLALAGCAASLSVPERFFPVEADIAWLRQEDPGLFRRYVSDPSKERRNDFITARMYAIDVAYTRYEAALTQEGQEANFLAAIGSLGLTTASNISTVARTSKILSELSGFTAAAGLAYNDRILLKQTMQHIQTGMRTARYEQAAVIMNNMKCTVEAYPVGLALSDLELYYRAGTITSGLIKVTETVNKASVQAKAEKDAKTPGGSTAAAATIAADAAQSVVKSQNAETPPSCAQGASIVIGVDGQRAPRPRRK
jgi:hypothetical protein